jgi:hypothetical protein
MLNRSAFSTAQRLTQGFPMPAIKALRKLSALFGDTALPPCPSCRAMQHRNGY